MIALSLLLFAGAFEMSIAFPNGAPNEICESMLPKESIHGIPQQSPSPYKISCRQDEQKPFRIVMTVSGEEFKGLLIQLQDKSGAKVGKFVGKTAAGFKRSCGNRAVTHANKDLKRDVKFTAIVNPSKVMEGLKCVATIVKEKMEFWMNQSTDIVLAENIPERADMPVAKKRLRKLGKGKGKILKKVAGKMKKSLRARQMMRKQQSKP